MLGIPSSSEHGHSHEHCKHVLRTWTQHIFLLMSHVMSGNMQCKHKVMDDMIFPANRTWNINRKEQKEKIPNEISLNRQTRKHFEWLCQEMNGISDEWKHINGVDIPGKLLYKNSSRQTSPNRMNVKPSATEVLNLQDSYYLLFLQIRPSEKSSDLSQNFLLLSACHFGWRENFSDLEKRKSWEWSWCSE